MATPAVDPQVARQEPLKVNGLGGLLRYAFCGGLAGVLSGIVFLGAGSRAVMRISALLDPEAEGAITENGNVIGEITLEGSIGLLIFEGIFGGLIAGLLWVLVREWLPQKAWLRIPLAGVVAALLGSFLVISKTNEDFHSLEPRWANVAMFIAIVGLTGSGTALLDRGLDHVLGRGGKSLPIFAVLTVIGGVMSVALVTQAFLSEEFCGCEDPPRLAFPFIALLAAATLLKWYVHLRKGRWPEWPWLKSLGVAAVAGACLVAAADLIVEILAIA